MPFTSFVASLLLAAAPTSGGRDVTGAFEAPDGLEVKEWATSPLFFNPTNIDVDARGRVWVAEGVNYRVDIRRSKPGDGYLRHEKGDRIVILEDTDGDGAADSSKVFVEDPQLVSPLGVAVIGNRVVVSCSPNIFVYTDTDGDDRADKKEVFLTGFGGSDHDHGVHAVTFGPDGRWYFAAGNMGHEVQDKSGWKLSSTSWRDTQARVSADGRKWLVGLVLRINPDGTGLRVMAHNFRNNYEAGLDAFGNLWQNDNDDDGNASCRITQVVEGGNYGIQSADGSRPWWYDRRRGQDVQTAHWHQEDPGVIPPTVVTGAGAPTGLVVYEGKLLPERYRGMVLSADAGRSTIWGLVPRRSGAGFGAARTKFLAARPEGDESHLFRPSDVAVGTDGAVFVADWYDPIVGGHGMRDKTGHGRIFRIVPRGMGRTPPPAAAAGSEDPVAALLSPAVNVRATGWQRLEAQRDRGVAAVSRRLAGATDARDRARLLWFLARAGSKGRPVVARALADPDPDVRLAAFRALRSGSADFLPYAARLARDPSAAVRGEVALSLRDQPVARSGKLLLELAARHDGRDRIHVEALGIGFDGKEDALYPALLARFGGGDPVAWPKPLSDLVWRLHPRASVAALRARAGAPSLPAAERERALVALAFVPARAAADAVLAIAENGDEPWKSLARDLALARASNEWKEFGVAERYKAADERGGAKAEEQAHLTALQTALTDGKASPEARAKVVQELAGSKEGGLRVIGLVSQKKLSEPLKAAAADVIFHNPDVGVRALASQYFKRPSFDGVEYPPVAALLQMKGDPSAGKRLFFGERAACSKCHEHSGQGGSIGPSLNQIAGKLGREALFDSILNPSAAIADGYHLWIITTKDQQTYSGFLAGEADRLLLKDISGETHLIPVSQISHRQRERQSLMPDNIALTMKPQELVDLVAFLAGEPAALRARTKKVVFIAGTASHGYGAHDHKSGCHLLADHLTASGLGIQAVVHHPGWPADPKVLDDADALVVYSNGDTEHPILPHLGEIAARAKQGLGTGFIHFAVEVPKGPAGDAFLDWTGGYFELGWSVNPYWTPATVTLANHPITSGVRPYVLLDEWYYHMRFRPGLEGVTPILTVVPPADTLTRPDGPREGNPAVRRAVTEGRAEPLMWARERPDGGRGFGFTGGHVHWNWAHPDHRRLVLNAIAWIAKVEIPPGGVPTRPVALGDLLQNQDEPRPALFDQAKTADLVTKLGRTGSSF